MEYRPPPQPEFHLDNNHGQSESDTNAGFQLQPPFHIGHQGGSNYQYGWQQPNGISGMHPLGQNNQQQPLAGPSSGTAYWHNQERDYMADLMTNFQRQHEAKVQNRQSGRSNHAEPPQPPLATYAQNGEPITQGGAYDRYAARRAQRQHERDEQQRIEAEQQATIRRQQEEARAAQQAAEEAAALQAQAAAAAGNASSNIGCCTTSCTSGSYPVAYSSSGLPIIPGIFT